MAYVQIPKDLNKIKTKIAFNLTKRQLIGFGIAGTLGIPLYLWTREAVGNDIAMLLMMIVVFPIFILTFYEKDGLSCEKYLKYIYLYMFYQPKIRVRKRSYLMKLRHDGYTRSSKKKRVPSKTRTNKKVFTIFDGLRLEKKKYTIEDTIDFKRMYQDGVCQIDENHYSKMVAFQDINYQLVLEEDRNMIFDEYVKFLNSFDASIKFSLSFVNQLGRNQELEEAIELPEKEDAFNGVRQEFRDMLKDQLAKGNNGLKRSKHLVFTIQAPSLSQARIKLERVEIDILSGFSSMGVKAESLNGSERLKIMHDMLNPDNEFDMKTVDWKSKFQKEGIAPQTMNFYCSDGFKMNDYRYSASQLMIMASELSDRMLSELLSLEDNLYMSMQVEAIDQVEAIKLIKRKNTDLQRMMIEEQKKAVRAGYDMDIIPSDLNTYGVDIKNLLHNLQSRDEKLFLVNISILNFARKKQALNNAISSLTSICNRHNCALKKLDYRQEQALNTVLPIGSNKLETKRRLTSSSTAVFIPFTTEELFMNSKTSLYYGLNALSHNLIMADRKMLKNPNGLILGTPGAGKSFSAKREIANVILATDDDIIICDPEGEYGNIVKQFGGEVIKVSAKSKDYLNPLDLNMNYGDGDAPLKDKANFVMSLLELVVGGSGLSAEEKSVIDRCLPKIYENYFNDPCPENMPILQDLYDLLIKQEESVGKKLATELEIYVSGSLNVFNHRSNVNLDEKLLCFDIKELGAQLKKIGMLVIQDQVWNKVSQNRNSHKSTRYYIDEFHLLLKDEQTASYCVEIWKRFRKWGGIPTGITQNVKDLLGSLEIENIFDNTDFILMLNQASGDREILAQKLKISPYQLNYVTNSDAGEGLLFFGNTIVPFIDKFPKETVLYQKMTTRPEEM